MVMQVGERVVLDEALFARLQDDPEFHAAYARLVPLEHRMGEWLEAQKPQA